MACHPIERGDVTSNVRTPFDSQSLTKRAVYGHLWQIYNIGRLRGPVPWANKSIGIESAWDMNPASLRSFCFRVLWLLALRRARSRPGARVGEAAVVKNEVVRVMASATSQINVGDGVLRDEIVRTGLDSAARLVMADSTNLSLGPSATVKLDRTVFNDEHTYRDIAIRLTTGAFRFVTGHSEKTAYKITTSVATIGVRGTILDILSQRSKTTVVLQEGASHVCTTGGQCIELTSPAIPPSSPRPPARSRFRRPTTRPGPSPGPAERRRDFAAPRSMRMQRQP